MPQISVIVPVYKVEKYIHRCIDSILAQTFTDFELILVDDGSPDNCGAICDEYAAKDSRVVVIHQENGGLSAARNAGIDWAFANSDSEWLTFIDSDDRVHVDYLKSLFVCTETAGVQVARCHLAMDGNIALVEAFTELIFLVEASEKAYISDSIDMSACGKLYHKELFVNIRFPLGKLHEDAFTTYKVLFAVKRIATIDKQMYFCEHNVDSITRSDWRPARLDEVEAYEEQLAFFRKNGFERVYKRIILGHLHVIEKQYKEIQTSCIRNAEKRKYLRLASHKMRTALAKHRKEVRITINNEPGVMEVAYPCFMKLYWYIKSFFSKWAVK